MPFLPEGVCEHGRIRSGDEGCETEQLRVIGYDHEIERSLESNGLPRIRGHRLATREAVGLVRAELRTHHARVGGVSRV